MGMYDYVDFKMNCPNCGRELSSFQTKDSECLLDTIDYRMVRNFYDYCDCGTWIEFTKSDRSIANDISDYTMEVKLPSKETK